MVLIQILYLGLEDSVYGNTFSIDKEMPNLYRLADVVVYPSTAEEPFGLTMLEAMASAKPIIVSNSGGMPEIVKDDVNGYVVQKGNHEALAERIIQLLADQDLRQKLGNTGREQVMNMYSKELYAKNIFNVYKDVLEKHSKKKGKKKIKARRKFIVARDEVRS